MPVIFGLLLAWSLAAPPGPANAMMAELAARRGWSAGIMTGLGAITADFAMFLLMWLGVLRVLAFMPWLQVVLGAVGVVLMLRFAWGAYAAARAPATADASARGGFVKAFLTIITSPFNHAWWATAGATMFAELGIWVVVGFFGGLLTWVVFWCGLAQAGARIRRFSEIVGYASAVLLAFFAIVVAVFTVRTALTLWAA